MTTDLPTNNEGNAALMRYEREGFADVAETELHKAQPARGRQAADAMPEAGDPPRYACSRNHVDGAVTRLPPDIRHGIVTLAEIRDLAFEQNGGRAAELINVLGWRTHYRRLRRDGRAATGRPGAVQGRICCYRPIIQTAARDGAWRDPRRLHGRFDVGSRPHRLPAQPLSDVRRGVCRALTVRTPAGRGHVVLLPPHPW